MWCAVQMMMNGRKQGSLGFKFNGRLYEHLRIKRNAMISAKLKGKSRPWQLGVKRSAETKRRQSLALKGRPRPDLRGRKISDKARATLANYRNGNTYTRGTKWWNNGVDERRAFDCPGEGWKLGRIGSFKSYERTPEWRSRHSELLKGRHWYNNGEVNVLVDECPSGFVEGRIANNG